MTAMNAIAFRARLVTIIDEAWGLQPLMDDEELLTFLEQALFRKRQARSRLCAVADVAAELVAMDSWLVHDDTCGGAALSPASQDARNRLRAALDKVNP